MISFNTHTYSFLKRKEIWFYNGEPIDRGNYTVFSAAAKTAGSDNRFIEKYFTTIIDLTKPEEELLNAIHSTYRYDIRSAGKQEVKQKIILEPTKKDIENLVSSYNLFAKSKNLPAMNSKRFAAICESGHLAISFALVNEIILATHIYIHDKNIVALTQSFHNIEFTDDKLRSEANKFLHWKDILFFKESGFKKYDFGGLNQEKLPGVSKFKLNFGGETVENYRFIKASPLIFMIVKLIKKFN